MQVNYGHPLAAGLHSAVLPGVRADLVSGRALYYSHQELLSPLFSQNGRVETIAGTVTGLPYVIVPAAGLATREFSFAARVRRRAGTGVCARAGLANILLWTSIGNWDIRIGGTNYTQGGVSAVDTWYDVVVTGSTTSAQLYVDTSVVISGGAPASGTLGDLHMGADILGGGGSWDVDFEWLALWSRALSADEVRALASSPYEIYKDEPVRIYSLPSGPIIPYISSVTMSNILQNSATTNIQLTF